MTEKKREERIFDKPTKEQVKVVLAKAKKKMQEKKKGAPDKFDLLLTKIDGIVRRQDKLESVYSKAVVTATPGASSEKKATDQEKQLTNEEKLAQVQAEQEKGTGQEQAGQTQTQPFYESPEYAKLSDKEKRLAWEERARQQQAQHQQGQQQGGKLSNQQLLYGAIEVAKVFAPVAQTAIAKGSSDGSPLKTFFDQLGTYQKIESTIMNGFFNFMRNLSPGQREKQMDFIATSSPGKVEVPKNDEGRIK
ncbi:hypothetical protein ES702_07387 [subsurface metagenome]